MLPRYTYDDMLFNEKYEKYHKLIYCTAYQYMFNIQFAEDVTQEAFVKLFTYRKAFNDEEHEKAWLLRVTVNLCKNILSSKNYQTLSINEEDSMLKVSSFEDASNQKLDFMNELRKLSPEQRTALYLFHYEGYAIKDISKIMKLKENTVKSHLNRAKQNLKISLERKERKR